MDGWMALQRFCDQTDDYRKSIQERVCLSVSDPDIQFGPIAN